jgi:plastocyanin domain-containing protein
MTKLIWIGIAALALTGCSTNSGDTKSGAIAISVTEKGFVPASVTVERGAPVTLVVTRKTDRTCAKDFVMESEHIRKALPLNQPVEITFTPTEKGELRYACAMDMVAGKVIVR